MIQTLPLVLFIVLSELAVGEFVLLYALDWRNQAKRNFLVLYGLIYLGVTGLTLLFQQNFSTPALLNSFPQLDKAWTGYETLPLVLFLLLLIPYNVFLWMDKKAGISKALEKGLPLEEGEESKKGKGRQWNSSAIRTLRLVTGGLAVLAGLATLLVMGMIYRPLAAQSVAGAFTVAGFFASAITLGAVMTAMWLGHWYLVTPAMTEKPLQFAVTVILGATLALGIFTFAAGPTTSAANTTHTSSSTTIVPAQASPNATTVISAATPTPGTQVKPSNVPVVTPLSVDAINWLRILISFVMPLILSALAWKLVRDRSFQSATGMLYLVVVLALAGECIARGLFLMGLT